MIYDDYVWDDFYGTWISASEYQEMIELFNNWNNTSLNSFSITD